MANDKNGSNILQEYDSKIAGLQKELDAKNKELEKVKESNIKTDLTANIRKQRTFEASYKNGYSDGTVKKAREILSAKVVQK